MEKLTSILVVANRTSADGMLVAKAVALARSVGAQIYLFSCDAQLARLLRDSYPTQEAEKAWNINLAEHLTHLRRLQAEACAPDLQISVDATCHSPLYEGIVSKIREIRPDLVMKSPVGAHPMRRFGFHPNDWQLANACPTTLMLVRPNPWRAVPKFAALVDVSGEGTARFAQTIVHTSQYFSLGCGGDLDIVYSEASTERREVSERLDSLQRLSREYHVDASHLHVLSGDPDEVVPDFAANQNYDAVMLGALTHRKGIAGVRGMLTSRIADAVDCDLILVERGAGNMAEDSSAIRQPNAAGSSVLWHATFGD